MSKPNVVILAAGSGERLKPFTKIMPKPLIKIGSFSVLEHQIKLLSHHNFRNILIVTGYLEKKIFEESTRWSKYGVKISFQTAKPIGTLEALRQIHRKVSNNFLLLYGDVMTNLDLKRLYNYHLKESSDITITSHRTDHPWDSDLLLLGSKNSIKKIYHLEKKGQNRSNHYSSGAIFVLNSRTLNYLNLVKHGDLMKDLVPKLLYQKNFIVKSYLTTEYMKDMGTPQRLWKVRADYQKGIRGFNQKKPVVFLDRDGVINKEVNLLHKISEIEILGQAISGIKKLNDAGFLVIIISNQPVVARGLCTEREVMNINQKIIELLAQNGAVINAYYYCPHHPEKGYPDENPAYKTNCDCRKPKTGLMKKALLDFDIDMEKSWFVGDTTTDIQTGKNVGVRTILVLTGYAGRDKKYDVVANFVAANLCKGAEIIVEHG